MELANIDENPELGDPELGRVNGKTSSYASSKLEIARPLVRYYCFFFRRDDCSLPVVTTICNNLFIIDK